MMLVVSMPFQDSLPLTYLAGCVGATILEYVTGVTMEALFKVRYWDYSNQKLNFQGHICLKSTLAWGGLTILMTGFIQRYVEQILFLIPSQVLTAVTFVLTAGIFADFAISFKAALDLRDVLIKLEEAKIELGHLQMRMDVVIALTAEELEQKKEELLQKKEELMQKRDAFGLLVSEFFEEAGNAIQSLEPKALREKLQERYELKKKEMQLRRAEVASGMERQLRRVFRANPSIRSLTYRDAFEELRKNLKNGQK